MRTVPVSWEVALKVNHEAVSSKSGSRVLRVVAAICSVVVAVLVAEVVVRVAGLGPEYFEPRRDMVRPRGVYQRLPYAFVPYSVFRSVYPSDPRGYFGEGNSVDHEFNSAGWRDIEHTLAKLPHTYRILGLGDSYLFGQGVHFEDVCLTKLGRLLQQAAPADVSVETINTGVPGFNTEAEQRLLATRGLVYQPDLVIVHFVLNDIEKSLAGRGPKLEFFREYVDVYNRPDSLSRYSQLWGLARQTWQRQVDGRQYLRDSLNSYLADPAKFDAMWTSVEGIRALCEKNHARLLVVIFPFFVNLDRDYPFRPIHDRIALRCKQFGIPVLDLREAYVGYRGPELWVHPVDQHPNERAHGIAAQAIAQYVLQQRGRLHLFERAATAEAR